MTTIILPGRLFSVSMTFATTQFQQQNGQNSAIKTVSPLTPNTWSFDMSKVNAILDELNMRDRVTYTFAGENSELAIVFQNEADAVLFKLKA